MDCDSVPIRKLVCFYSIHVIVEYKLSGSKIICHQLLITLYNWHIIKLLTVTLVVALSTSVVIFVITTIFPFALTFIRNLILTPDLMQKLNESLQKCIFLVKLEEYHSVFTNFDIFAFHAPKRSP